LSRAYQRDLEGLKTETRRVDFMVMILLVAAFAIAGVVAMSIWCVLATAEMVYGYPVGRRLIRRTIGRLDERQFLASDIEDLNEAFTRVAHSDTITD
jgi:hypothetical protein